MKNLMIVLVILFSVGAANAQFVVVSQNKCNMNNISDLNKLIKESGGVILNDLVKEGKLMNWGVMNHNWGDEWNWVIYYVAEDRGKFFGVWDEFVKRFKEKDPEAFDKFGQWCTEHKDSMYTQVDGYDNSQENADE